MFVDPLSGIVIADVTVDADGTIAGDPTTGVALAPAGGIGTGPSTGSATSSVDGGGAVGGAVGPPVTHLPAIVLHNSDLDKQRREARRRDADPGDRACAPFYDCLLDCMLSVRVDS